MRVAVNKHSPYDTLFFIGNKIPNFLRQNIQQIQYLKTDRMLYRIKIKSENDTWFTFIRLIRFYTSETKFVEECIDVPKYFKPHSLKENQPLTHSHAFLRT